MADGPSFSWAPCFAQPALPLPLPLLPSWLLRLCCLCGERERELACLCVWMKSFINARSRGKAEAEAVAATWKPDADCHASCCAPPTPAGCCCNVSMQQRRNASLCAWNYASNFNPWQQATSKCARHEILALGFPSPSLLPPCFSLSPCSLLCLLPALSRTYLQLALCINGATLSAQHSHAACKGGDWDWAIR